MANRTHARRDEAERTLSLDPRIRRLAAVYFEHALLIDWKLWNIRKDPPDIRVRKWLIPALVRLLDHYEPTVLLLPDIGPGGVRRSANVRLMIEAIDREARRRGIEVLAISEKRVRAVFERRKAGAGRNKRAMNDIMLEWFPDLVSLRPRIRREWHAERHAQPLFDALARWCAWFGLARRSVHA